MTDKKEIPTEILLADCLIRISVLEKIIIDAKIASKEQINEEVLKLSNQIADSIMKNVNVHN